MDTGIPIGAFEAKTRLSQLLERVQRGEAFTITKHGRQVATLAAYASGRAAERRVAVAALRRLQERYRLGGLDLKALREEGRR